MAIAKEVETVRVYTTKTGRRIWLDDRGDAVKAECSACGEVKAADAFNRQKANKGGRQSYCRECVAERTRKAQDERAKRRDERQAEAYGDKLNAYADRGWTGRLLYGGNVAYFEGETLKARSCTDCGKVKTRDAFSRDKSKVGGVHVVCKSCAAKRNAKRRKDYKAPDDSDTLDRFKSEGLKGVRLPRGNYAWEDASGIVQKRTCTDCGDVKDRAAFHTAKSKYGGIMPTCRDCRADQKAAKYSAHPVKLEHGDNKRLAESYQAQGFTMRRLGSGNFAMMDGETVVARTCIACDDLKPATDFRANTNGFGGLRGTCAECDGERKREYEQTERGRELRILQGQRRRARVRSLPDTFDEYDLERLHDQFGMGVCALTGEQVDSIDLDHVIPLYVGAGGTVRGNMIPIRHDLNRSKGSRNIFEWFADNWRRLELCPARFFALIEWLASENAMTAADYYDYVCEAHRIADERGYTPDDIEDGADE